MVSAIGNAVFRLAGPAQAQRWLRRWANRGRPVDATEASPGAVRDLVRAQRAFRRVTGIEGTCLSNSMILWALLRRDGIDSDIRVGVRKNGNGIEAHAWVEVDRRPVNEEPSVLAEYVSYSEPVFFDR